MGQKPEFTTIPGIRSLSDGTNVVQAPASNIEFQSTDETIEIEGDVVNRKMDLRSGATGNEIKIDSINISSINTEFSYPLQNNTRSIIINVRTGSPKAQLKIAFVINESGTKYFTVSKGNGLELDYLNLSGKTLYIQSPTVTVVEVLEIYKT